MYDKLQLKLRIFLETVKSYHNISTLILLSFKQVFAFMDKKTFAFITAFFSFLIWGVLVIYWHQLSSVNPLEVVAHRAVWSLVLTAVLVLVTKKAGEAAAILKNPKNILPLILSSILIAGNWGLFIWAVAHDRILESSMGNYITPLFNVAASAIIFKAALNKYQKLSVFLALSGVIYMIAVYGQVPYIALFYAITFCIYGIIKKLVPASALTGLFIETLIISVPSAIYVLYLISTGESAVLKGDYFITFMLVCGGVVTTLPLLGFSYSAKVLHLSTLGILQYITPTIVFLLGVFVYNEYFSANMLLTFVLIWAGLIIYSADGLIQLKKSKKNIYRD